jgi:hypothetical protein
LFFAKDFGSISPKIRTTTVITAVAIATPELPKISVAITVPRDDIKILTILFPINIAVRALLYVLAISRAFFADLFPFCALLFKRILLTHAKAVSLAENKPDKRRRTIIKRIFKISDLTSKI